MRYTPVRYTKGTSVTAKGRDAKVVSQRPNGQVVVKLPNGSQVTVESYDVKKKG